MSHSAPIAEIRARSLETKKGVYGHDLGDCRVKKVEEFDSSTYKCNEADEDKEGDAPAQM